MNKIIEMQRKKEELIKALRLMNDKADEEKRKLTDEENVEYKKNEEEIEQLSKDILDAKEDVERRRKLAELELEAKKKESDLGIHIDHKLDHDPEKEFKNVGEFFYALSRAKRDGIRDERLENLRIEEKRAQSMGTGSEGGYALPEQFDAMVRQVQAQEAIVRPRANVIPAGSPPDAKLSFPALDQTSGSNIYGGVTITHTGEAITMTETSFALREVSLEPKEMSAYIVLSNKLLQNWEAAGAFATRTLSSAMAGQEDYDFMRGDGINKALGFINCSAAISYSRATASTVAFADVYGMLARMLMRGGGSYVWLASQTIIPQLAAMVDAGTHAVWLGGAGPANNAGAGPLPSTLLGIPVVFADRLPALGTKGDLSLVNLSMYLIKDGSGPIAASSEHIYFLSNRTVFKIVWNVDAKPWLTEAIGLEGSTTNTVSPFIILT